MDHRNRDMGINYIKTRKKHPCYGMGLGIIVLDDPYPGFPGDVRNASAFPYPIQYEIAEGVDNYTLVWKEDKSPCLEPIKRAAKKAGKYRLSRHCSRMRLFRLFSKRHRRLCGHTGIYVKLTAGAVYSAAYWPSKSSRNCMRSKTILDRHPFAKCGY